MAKKLSAKQIRFFGTARQKAALKAKRRKPKARRSNPRRAHRRRSNPPKPRAAAAPKKHRRRAKSSARRKTKRRNPVPQIIAWTAGNPAKRRSMPARKKHRRRASASRSNAGTRRRRRNPTVRHHRRRRNPGALGSPMEWVMGGAGVVAGGVGSRIIPQLILGASNTGAMGYAANAVTALALGWGAHMIFKKNILTVTIIAGGFGSLIQRIVTEQTPYGSVLSTPAAGMGDWGLGLYQKSNYLTPQRIQGPRGPASSQFYWGDGSQAAVPSFANQGMDGSGANC